MKRKHIIDTDDDVKEAGAPQPLNFSLKSPPKDLWATLVLQGTLGFVARLKFSGDAKQFMLKFTPMEGGVSGAVIFQNKSPEKTKILDSSWTLNLMVKYGFLQEEKKTVGVFGSSGVQMRLATLLAHLFDDLWKSQMFDFCETRWRCPASPPAEITWPPFQDPSNEFARSKEFKDQELTFAIDQPPKNLAEVLFATYSTDSSLWSFYSEEKDTKFAIRFSVVGGCCLGRMIMMKDNVEKIRSSSCILDAINRYGCSISWRGGKDRMQGFAEWSQPAMEMPLTRMWKCLLQELHQSNLVSSCTVTFPKRVKE